MRSVALLLALLSLSGCECCIADDPTIVIPVQPVPEVDDTPRPVTTLADDEMYVIASEVPLIVLASPVGIVSSESTDGPMTIRGRFAGGTKNETRRYTAKHLYLVESASAGVVELLIVPVGVSAESDVIRQVLTVSGVGPRPGPVDPVVPVEPVEPVEPLKGSLQVVIIEETADRGALPASQIDAMLGQSVREYCRTHCKKSDGKTPDFRLLDDDDNVAAADKWIQDAFALPRTSLPWVAVSNGKGGASEALPATSEDLLKLLKKYGGD